MLPVPLSTWPLAIGLAAVACVAVLSAAAVLGISALAAYRVVRPPRSWCPDGWQPPAEGEPVTFRNAAGLLLAGWFVPPLDGKAVAIVCHGFGTNCREGQDLLPCLRARGYGVLFFDFQAHGSSEGRYTTVGAREVGDFLAAVDYVQRRVGTEVPLVAIGLSMGGAVAIMAAAQCPAIRAVVADSPFATLERAVARSFRLFLHLPPRVFARPTIWFAERFTGVRVHEVRPIEAVGLLAPRPLLLIQGTDDEIVDPEDCLLLHAAAGEPKHLWRVDGIGHVQARLTQPEEYARRVCAFLDAALSAAPVTASPRQTTPS